MYRIKGRDLLNANNNDTMSEGESEKTFEVSIKNTGNDIQKISVDYKSLVKFKEFISPVTESNKKGGNV